MSRVELPTLHWLVSMHEGRTVTNTYSASLGTLPSTGCMNVWTFNYRVYVDITAHRLIAESYILNPWSAGGNKSDAERAEFEVSDSGVLLASEWLSQTATKYGF